MNAQHPAPEDPLPPHDEEERNLQKPVGPHRGPDADAVGEGDVEELAQETDGDVVQERERETQDDNIRAEADDDSAPGGRAEPVAHPRRRREPLAPAEIETFRAALLEMKTRSRGMMERLAEQAGQDNPASTGETSSLPLHLGNVGSETFEQDADLGLAERERRDIEAIDRALQRMEEGLYGLCESCGGPIARERLTALPYAVRCVACQRAQDAA